MNQHYCAGSIFTAFIESEIILGEDSLLKKMKAHHGSTSSDPSKAHLSDRGYPAPFCPHIWRGVPFETLYAPSQRATSSPIRITRSSLASSSSRAAFRASRTVIWSVAIKYKVLNLKEQTNNNTLIHSPFLHLPLRQALNFIILKARPLFSRAHSFTTARIGRIRKGTTNVQGQIVILERGIEPNQRPWPWEPLICLSSAKK